MLVRRLGVLCAVLVALAVPATGAFAATAHPARQVLTVSGAVSNPASYTASQLAALPTEMIQLRGPGGRVVTAMGVSLDLLVTTASPVLPVAKNALLRVIVTASEPSGLRVSFALGE